MKYRFVLTILLSIVVNCGEDDDSRRFLQQETSGGANSEPGPGETPVQCQEGERKPAPDGCNTCSCSEGQWACTELGCIDPPAKPEACVDNLPADLEARIEAAYQENIAARDAAIAAERTRLNVTPLKPTTLLTTHGTDEMRYRPEVDPFPTSVVAVGESDDIRANGYELNHGKMGMTRVYETAPGSKRYFIVDRIDGDGIGSNGRDVVAESVEYALALSLDGDAPLEGQSWHSWHVTTDNRLARAIQLPKDAVQQELRICGCGPRGYEVDAKVAAGADMAMAAYRIGIFMLPGDTLPVVQPIGTFSAPFPRKYFKKIYVPSPGKQCREYEVVC